MSLKNPHDDSLENRATRINGICLAKDMVVGNLTLDKRLGKGGMGEVWRAVDPTRGDASNPGYVALKFVPREIQDSEREMRRVVETFRAVQALQHPNICPVYALQEISPFGQVLIMKYVDGMNLMQYRDAYFKKHGEFPLKEVVRVLTPIAAALDYAHHPEKIHVGVKGVIHRDVKPENILISRNGREIQLVDFGLAAQVRLSMSRVSNIEMDSVGTRSYMSPEAWKGQLQDGRSDQYSLATVAYELISNRLPFDVADPFQLKQCVLNEQVHSIEEISMQQNLALQQALAKSSQYRFETCTSFLIKLNERLVASGEESCSKSDNLDVATPTIVSDNWSNTKEGHSTPKPMAIADTAAKMQQPQSTPMAINTLLNERLFDLGKTHLAKFRLNQVLIFMVLAGMGIVALVTTAVRFNLYEQPHTYFDYSPEGPRKEVLRLNQSFKGGNVDKSLLKYGSWKDASDTSNAHLIKDRAALVEYEALLREVEEKIEKRKQAMWSESQAMGVGFLGSLSCVVFTIAVFWKTQQRMQRNRFDAALCQLQTSFPEPVARLGGVEVISQPASFAEALVENKDYLVIDEANLALAQQLKGIVAKLKTTK